MPFYRRRLPHISETDRPVFVTWRLEESLPPHRHFDERAMTSLEAFQTLDRLLDETRTGARHLADPAVATMVAESIVHCAEVLDLYALHAYAVMPNHVHILITPRTPLPKILKSLKGFTARRANVMLDQPGRRFWLEESFDHQIRDREEFDAVRRYSEENPVRAQLVGHAEDYAWSSASGQPQDERG